MKLNTRIKMNTLSEFRRAMTQIVSAKILYSICTRFALD